MTPATPADRLLVAKGAMEGLLSHFGDSLPAERTAELATTYADALLRRLGRGTDPVLTCEFCPAGGGHCCVCGAT